MAAPRNGPAVPWVGGAAIIELPRIATAAAAAVAAGKFTSERIGELAEMAALAASEVLYEKSGRVFTGEAGPVTVRPVSRPTDDDARALWTWGDGYSSSWGSCSWGVHSGVVSHHGCSNPPEVELGVYPVTEIELVKIDGVVIPSTEYELVDHRVLVRVRQTQSSLPTQRFGWPTCQRLDVVDGPGTFLVTFRYGQPPPALGVIAATKLAEYLLLPQLGDPRALPLRVNQVQRQGVSATVSDVVDLMSKGRTGIYDVDLFLDTVNPGQNRRQARVWSPDLSRARRRRTITS